MQNSYQIEFNRSGNIAEGLPLYLASYGRQDTAEHCTAIAAKAIELAEKFGSDPDRAEQAGYSVGRYPTPA